MAQNFYKKDGSYYTEGTNTKVSNLDELKKLSQAGGKEISVPSTTTPDSSSVPSGSTLITDPSKLSGLKETDIFRDPNSQKIYKIPPVPSISEVPNQNLSENIPSPSLPETSADKIQNSFVEGATANIETQKKNLMDVYTKQIEEQRKQIEDLQKEAEAEKVKQEEVIKNTAPENLPYAEEVASITKDRLAAAKTASSTLESNFLANQNSISELEMIMNRVNADTKAAENEPGLAANKAYNISQVKSDGIARVGVIQAVMSARNGQINTAQDLIDNAYTSVNSAKTDALNYYQNLMNFYSETKKDKDTKIATLTNDEKKTIESQIGLLENQIAESAEVKDTISKMITENPNMVEQAGIKLTDTMEQIQTKMAKWQNTYGGVAELMNSYPDAGIRLTDTIDQANTKLKTSRIYQDKVRGPIGTSIPSSSTIVDSNGKPIKLTATQVDTVSSFENSLNQIEEIKPLLSQVNTGPVSAVASDFLRLFSADDPKRVELDAKLNSIKANFMKAMSGAAVSESEVKRLAKFLPSISDTEQVIQIKVNELENAVKQQKESFMKTVGAVETLKDNIINDPLNLEIK